MINSQTILNFIQDNFPGFNQKGDEINFNSPFFPDKKKRLYVNTSTGKWYDQHDQRGGNFISFVSEYLGVNYNDAETILESDYKTYSVNNLVDIRDLLMGNMSEPVVLNEDVQILDPLDINPIMFNEVDELDEDGELALEYLQNRKIDVKHLGYFPKSDKLYGGRIFIPFYENGELVYFLARSYIGSELRYKNPAGLATDCVFNFDNIEDTVVIFEGAFDAMSLDNYTGTAILSNKMKEGQANRLMSIEKLRNVIFVPDKDEKKETRKLILNNLIYNYELLNKYKIPSREINFYVYDIPDGYKDFNEYKVKTGNGKIFIKDCKKFSKAEIMMRTMLL